MTCSTVRLDLGAYALGGLSAAERDAVDRHLIDCPDCAAELSELEDATLLLSRVRAADFNDELAVRRSRRRLLIPAAAAAVVAAVVSVSIAAGHGSSVRTFSATSGSVRLTAQVRDQPGGAAFSLVATGLPDDEHCHLIAVSKTGVRQPAGSWTADYETATRVVETSSFSSSQLAGLELDGTDGKPLVTVPLR